MKRNKAITLLELLLVLGVLAALFFAVISYYEKTKQSRSVYETEKDLTVMAAALQSYWQDNKNSFLALNNTRQLVNEGYLNEDYEINRWGGEVQIKGVETRQASISLNSLPATACNALNRRYGMNKTCPVDLSARGARFTICVNDLQEFNECDNSYN